MQKRGLSSIVSVVLIVVLALLAIIFVWRIVSSAIRDAGETSEAKSALMYEKVNIQNVEGDFVNGHDIKILLERGPTKQQVVGETVVETSIRTDVISLVDGGAGVGAMFVCKDGNTDKASCVFDKADDPCSSFTPGAVAWYQCVYSNLNENTCKNLCGGTTWTPPYLENAKEANRKLVTDMLQTSTLQNTKRIGLIVYSGGIHVGSHPLSSDSASLLNSINSWYYGSNPGFVCNALYHTTDQFTSSAQIKTIILMVSNYSSQIENLNHCPSTVLTAKEAAARARSNSINVYVVGFGVASASPEEARLSEVAQAGGGQYFSANIDALAEAYSQIQTQIETQYKSILDSDYVQIVFIGVDGQSYSDVIPNPPQQAFETGLYTFNPAIPNIQKIYIYPVKITPSGKHIVSDTPTAVWSAS